MQLNFRTDPYSRLKQTIYFKRADHLLDLDEEYSKNGKIIIAVDSAIARDLVNEAVGKKSTGDTNPLKETRSYLGPKLHYATLVSLFASGLDSSRHEKILLLPGHLREFERAWNNSIKAVAQDSDEVPELEENLSVSIMRHLEAMKGEKDFSLIAANIQKALWAHLSNHRESNIFSRLMHKTMGDLSELFNGGFGETVANGLANAVGDASDLFSADENSDAISRVMRWAYTNNPDFHALNADDRTALLSLLILNEVLLPLETKIVLITDSLTIHRVADQYKFFDDPKQLHKFTRGAAYCVRDLKVTTNKLLRDADADLAEQKHYWADFLLEAATPFPVGDRETFLRHSSPLKLESLADTIAASRAYSQDRVYKEELAQFNYGEEIAKNASIQIVERFKERDFKTARKAALAWKAEQWSDFLTLARSSVSREVQEARREFIKAAVMRLVSRRGTEELEGPFKGRFFSCLYLEDHDSHHIAKAINELNEVADARTRLIQSLEGASAAEGKDNRSDYLVLLGAAALYSDLGHWDQAKLLCDEALLLRDSDSDYQGREAHFLLAVCHRMTVRERQDLDRARSKLEIAEELAADRDDGIFTGIRFKAERLAIDTADLAFDAFSSSPRKHIAKEISIRLDEVFELLNSGDKCSQEGVKKWAEISLRCTSFSLLLMLVFLEEKATIEQYKEPLSTLVLEQEIAACSYFSVDDQMRVSVRDGLLILFAASVTGTVLKPHAWVDKLLEQLNSDVLGTRRLAVYLPFDGHRFSVLVNHLKAKT